MAAASANWLESDAVDGDLVLALPWDDGLVLVGACHEVDVVDICFVSGNLGDPLEGVLDVPIWNPL